MRTSRMKALLGIILTVTLITVSPFTGTVPASAANAATAVEENALTALGFDPGALPEGFDGSDNAENPYGVNMTVVSPVSELYTGTASSADLYGDGLKLGASVTEFYSRVKDSAIIPQYQAYRLSAGNFAGTGLNGQIAAVAAKLNTDNTISLDLFLVDPDRSEAVLGGAVKHLLANTQNFGNRGKYAGEDFINFPYQLQNYLQLASGDFTGDGVDEIAVYIPDRGNSRVAVYQLKVGTGETAADLWQTAAEWDEIWSQPLYEGAFVSNMLSLAAGDMTGDGVDDLGITWGVYYGKDYNTSCKAVVLQGSKAGDAFQKNCSIPLTFGGTQIVRASLALGDVDGDGKDETVLGGQLLSDISNNDFNTRFLAMYEYKESDNSFTGIASGNMDLVDSEETDGDGIDDGDREYLSAPACVANLAVVKQDGVGTKEYIYLDSVLYHLADKQFTIIDEMDENGIPKLTSIRGNRSYAEFGAVAADFNGDGKETVLTMQYFSPEKTTFDDLFGGSLPWFWGDIGLENLPSKTNLIELDTSEDQVLAKTVYSGESCALAFAAPDTDTDTTLLKYTGTHFLAYSDPTVLAVLASPPYFRDLAHLDGGDDYISGSETVYGASSGSSTGNTSSSSISVGAYVSFEAEFSFFGIKGAKFETEVEYTHSWTKETESKSQLVQTVEYGTVGGQDTVVLYSIPMDVFVYDAYIPVMRSDGSVVWEKQTMNVNIPYTASVKTLTREDYDAIAEDYDMLPAIGGEVLSHTPGDPATYPVSTAGYKDVNIYSGDFAEVGYGSSGYITQSLDISTETSEGTSQSNAVSFKAGGGGGGLVVGVSAGWEGGAGTVTTSLSGNTFSGTIRGMPEDAQEYDYSYKWKVFQYTYKGEQNFPVVNYLLTDIKRPPKLPADFEMDGEGTTKNTVKLTWSKSDPNAVAFQLYRHYDFPDGSGDYPVSGIIASDSSEFFNEKTGKYEFTDTGNLSPYTQYDYRIQVIGSAYPYYSVLSDILPARTKAPAGEPVIALSKDYLLVYPDKKADVKVTVANTAENAQSPLYQWQKKIDDVWTGLNGRTTDTLEFTEAGSADAGLYRCRVNQIVGEYAISAYSDPVVVEYDKRTVSMDVTITMDSTSDRTPYITAELANAHTDSGSIPTGTLIFEISGNGYSKTYTADLDRSANGVAVCPEWLAPSNGAYQVTAFYSGSRVFKPATSESEIFLIGSDTDFWLEAQESIVYGESAEPAVMMYQYSGGDVQTTDLTQNPGSYTLDYNVTSQDGYPLIVKSGIVTPTHTGLYKLDVTVREAGVTVCTLTEEFTVAQKPVTLTAPSAVMANTAAAHPSAGDILAEPGTFEFEDTAENLGLSVRCIDTAGIAQILEPGCSPGQYITQVIADVNHADLQENYKFTFINGIYNITSQTYSVTGIAEKLLGQNVGEIHVIYPENHNDDWSKEYQRSTEIHFAAIPDTGYTLESWTVNGEVTSPSALVNPNLLIITMPDNALEVKVKFKVTGNTLVYEASHGAVVCTNSELLTSGAVVIENAEYQFKAVPDAGYHFDEWRLYQSGIESYPEGGIDENGFHTLAFTMGNTSAKLFAVFERDSYILTYGAHLSASYVWDHDGNISTPMEKVYPDSGSRIPGDAYVTIEPSVGYSISPAAVWYVNGLPLLNYSGSSYTFQITGPTEVDVDTDLQHYSITLKKEWAGSGAEPDGNSVKAAVNGDETEALTELEGGSLISFTAESAYGAVFDHWEAVLDGKAIDPSLLPDTNTYTFGPLGGNLEITAVFAANDSYTVTVTEGVHGSLSYTLNGGSPVFIENDAVEPTIINVFKGDDLIFAASPDENFMVGNWIIGDSSGVTTHHTTAKTWNLTNVSSNMSVDVNFTAMSYYKVTFSSTAGGSIYAVMDDTVPLISGAEPGGGTEITFTAYPDDGMVVSGWTVNGDTVTSEKGAVYLEKIFTIDALSENIDVEVSFGEIVLHTVAITAPENGSITGEYYPDGFDDDSTDEYEIRAGAAAEFLLTPDLGYAIKTVLINGIEADDHNIVRNSDGSWICTVYSVNEDITVSAEISKLYPITTGSASGGTVTISHNQAYKGQQVTITALPANNYRFDGWTIVPDTVKPADSSAGTTTFMMPDFAVTITPRFAYSGGGGDGSGGGGGGGTEAAPAPEKIPWANPFTDVSEENWFFDAVKYVCENGLFNGTSPTTFSPNESMTRGMFVTVLGRYAKIDPSSYTGSQFHDAAVGSWCTPYIEWAVGSGIAGGYGDGNFGMNDPINREQMAAMLARYIEARKVNVPVVSNDTAPFADEKEFSEWADQPILLMQNTGLIQGVGGNLFAPKKTATRAEVAAIMLRFSEVAAQ